MKLAADGPGVAPAREIVKSSNTAYPFISATTVVDIGCGPGQLTNAVVESYGSELGPNARLVALDISPGVIEQVQKRKADEVQKRNLCWDKVETLVSNANDLSAFADGSVSHALAGFLLFTIPEPHKVLQEIQRVLTAQSGGGVVAVSSLESSEWQDLMEFPRKIRSDKTLPVLPAVWRTEEGVRSELEEFGFRDVKVFKTESYMPFENYDEVARFILTKFPIMAKITADMTSEELGKVRDLMVEHIRASHPVLPGRLVGTAIIGIGRK